MRHHTHWFIAIVAMAAAALPVAIVNPGAAGATSAATKAKYVKTIRFLDPAAHGASAASILKLGNGVCADLKSGTTVKKLAAILKGPEKADLVEASAVLCPTFKKKVASYYATTTTTTAPQPVTLLSRSGTGGQSLPQFTVPAGNKGWTMTYTFNCSSFGSSGNFQVYITGYGRASDTIDQGANALATSGASTDSYFDTGTFSLMVNSECDWTIAVATTPA